jgi:hypothetical protein
MRSALTTFSSVALALGSVAVAQTAPATSGTQNAINGINSYPGPGLVKYQSVPDTLDRRIDMFIGDWHLSMPRVEHGSLILRDILTKGDHFDPPQMGAVLHYTNSRRLDHSLDAQRPAGDLLHSGRRGRGHLRGRHGQAAQGYRRAHARRR